MRNMFQYLVDNHDNQKHNMEDPEVYRKEKCHDAEYKNKSKSVHSVNVCVVPDNALF